MTDELTKNESSGMARRQQSPAVLELHIEELVLHGFPASDRLRIGDAIERELSRVIEAQGLGLTGPASMERLDAGSFKVAANATPRVIGAQVAHNLYRGLSAPPKVQRGGHEKRTHKG
jgi:hypothetical protein